MRISDWSSDVCSSDLEALDGFAGGGELAPVGAVARGLHREHEARRRLVMPLLPARRLEGGVVGAVDLDGGERAAGALPLALLRQPPGLDIGRASCRAIVCQYI